MTPTCYTVKMDGQYPYALVLKPDSTKAEKYEGYYNSRELQENMQDDFGSDVQCLSNAAFQAELEQRQMHTKEMIALLWKNGDDVGQYLCGHFVYGSPMRPMSASWARVHESAVYIPGEKQKTGYHTYVAVSILLDDEIIERYELEFVSRPAAEESAS